MEKRVIENDLVIIGAGIAGLTAAIYAKRGGLDLILLEKGVVGGQMAQSSIVENYPGFGSVTGAELAGKVRAQAASAGVTLDEFDLINETTLSDAAKTVETESSVYRPKAVIVATGTTPKPLPVPNAERLRGKGVHYCAICDGNAYKGKTVGVVGGGASALEEALYLAGIAEKVIIIRRGTGFSAEKTLSDKVSAAPNIEILLGADLLDVNGANALESITVAMSGGEEKREIQLSAVFTYIGSSPQTEFLNGALNLDEQGHIITGDGMETNITGVFAAGDVRQKKYRQIVTAASDGAIAALSAKKYIMEL